MGAGSAKGMQPDDDDDADKFSTTSSDQWANEDNSSDDDNSNSDNNNKNQTKKTVAEISPGTQPATSSDLDKGGDKNVIIENGDAADTKKGETKKKFTLNFSNKKDDQSKVNDFVDDAEDDKKKKKDGDKKKEGKKDGEKKAGFKLFGWRNKKEGEKDVELDEDIDDLEKTFDSLGIVGKNMWGEESPKARTQAVDDLELLEPMRKRKNVRVRGTRGMNGVVAGPHEVNGRSSGEGSTGSRRTFKYSWETEKESHSISKHEDDEWEYKAVVIEGFDIDKFRKANKRDSVFDSTSLPNAVGGEDYDGGVRSPLRYDQNEQQILASIERDYTLN